MVEQQVDELSNLKIIDGDDRGKTRMLACELQGVRRLRMLVR